MKKLCLLIILVLVTVGIIAAAKQKNMNNDDAAFTQLQGTVRKHLSVAFNLHAKFFYNQGYREGYIAGAIECAKAHSKLEEAEL